MTKLNKNQDKLKCERCGKKFTKAEVKHNDNWCFKCIHEGIEEEGC